MRATLMTYFLLTALLLSQSCIQPVEHKEKLPVLGQKEVAVEQPDGSFRVDTVITLINSFQLIDQDSQTVNARMFENKIYVVDFFFTHCPTICPVMTKNMLKIYTHFEDNPHVLFLSHSIDVKNDSVPQLKSYAEKIGIDSKKWHMVTGEKNHIYGLAKEYMVSASEDNGAPGGYIHSGAFILMDGQHRIRGYYDGTKEEDVLQIIADIELLEKEQYREDKQ